MSIAGTATAIATAQTAQTRAALATEVIKQNHQAEEGLVALIEQAVEAGKQAAGSATAPGTGVVVDKRV